MQPQWPLFLKVNPPKEGLFQPKQGAPFGVLGTVYTYTLQGTDISPGSTKRDPGKVVPAGDIREVRSQEGIYKKR